MSKFDTPTAAAVIGLAGFQLLQAWNNNAPSLSDVRMADPDDPQAFVHFKQQLIDADFMVGGLAVILGVAFAIMTHDLTALLVMLIVFGSFSLWYHSVLTAEAR